MPTQTVDPRVAQMSVEKLAQIVDAAGGSIIKEWDYVYPPEEGGDGIRGVHVLYLADRDGTEIGNVGFAREVAPGGVGESLTIFDFWDNRHPVPNRTSWPVSQNPRGFLQLLAAFLPA